MNVLLIGGASSFLNNIILKLKKEGHRVYLLTGSRYDNRPYQKVFEKYNFGYDSTCLNEIFESIRPDVTIFMGAYDSNFSWKHEEEESVNYSARMMNILMAYVMAGTGKFIYLSASDVYSGYYEENITEDIAPTPTGYRGMVLAQAEEMCESYRKSCDKEIITLRLDNVYIVPEFQEDATDPCCELTKQALFKYSININPNQIYSLLYASDAVESIYRVVAADAPKRYLYNISSEERISEKELADIISKTCGFAINIVTSSTNDKRTVLSARAFREEFGYMASCQMDKSIKKIVEQMKRYRRTFVYGEERKKSLMDRINEKFSKSVRALIPFAENIVAFAIVTVISQLASNSETFSKMDFYLMYVLLFSVIYGQQQAIIASTLSVIGFFAIQLAGKTGINIFLDSSTYIWIAQLFIVGLVVGYMRDTITKLRREAEEEREYLSLQLRDIKDINDTNVRVKDALETQLINQNNTVGKIYSITSKIDQYNQEEVLFYAAQTVSELMKSDDVAIYQVANSDYARLISYTSEKAKVLGNSIKYNELEEMVSSFEEKNVFINRKLTEGLPVMASGIYDDDKKLEIIIMVWTLPWESMTLGQSNQLVVASALIRNAVVRANRYFEALESENFIGDSKVMEYKAFASIATAYVKAKNAGLTECIVLGVTGNEALPIEERGQQLYSMLRQHDYVGMLDMDSNSMGVLLANTNMQDAHIVIERMTKRGYNCEFLEVRL